MTDFPLDYTDPWIDPVTAPEPPYIEGADVLDQSPEWRAWRQWTHYEMHGGWSEVPGPRLTFAEMVEQGLICREPHGCNGYVWTVFWPRPQEPDDIPTPGGG